ncbi:MAG: mechanosensitive ion channel family protein [Alphaproteobacteria bacterium]|nr:MAG: hypothetical protein B6I23_03415 [Rickettsiaceae bacterium 4572_127]
MILLSEMYFGNSLLSYIIAFVIIFFGFFIGKSFNWLINNFVLKLVKKTETRLDDIIFEKLESHFSYIVIFFGLKLGLKQLILPQQIDFISNQLLFILITITISHAISRFFDALIEEYLVPLTEKSKNQVEFLPILRKSLSFSIWIIAIILIMNNAGYNVTSLLAGLGLGGLAFAMASKDYISNIFGGMTIFMDKTFKIKDRIRIGKFDGNIKEIGIRSTKLKTFDGTIVTIPNSQFTESMVENVSQAPSKKVIINLGITYETPLKKIEKLQKILPKITEENDNTKDDVIISLNHFGDFSLNIYFAFYIKNSSDYFKTVNEIHMEILKQFTKEKIDFAYPTQKMIK